MNKKTLKDFDYSGKRVLVRCDFNVPIQDGAISDDKRIVESLPTIKYLMGQGAKVILMSHLGRPKGEANPKYSLELVAKRLEELLGTTVKFLNDDNVVSEKTKNEILNLKDGEVALLQNTRFVNGDRKSVV